MEAINKRNSGKELLDILHNHKEFFLSKGSLCTDQHKAYRDDRLFRCPCCKKGRMVFKPLIDEGIP